MKRLFLDVETDGLLDTMTKVHCLVLRDLDTDDVLSCADQPGYQSIAAGVEASKSADLLYSHNLIRFDRPALDKLTNYQIPWEKVRDTLVIAGMRWTNLRELDQALAARRILPSQLIGKHSLEAWGYRLGVLKGNYGKSELGKKKRKRGQPEDPAELEKWKHWTQKMQDYCEQDTAVGAALTKQIWKAGVSPLAVETEQELCDYLNKQEQNGCPFNMEKAVELLGTLSARREELHNTLVSIFGTWTKPGKTFIPKRDDKKRGYVKGVPFTKTEEVTFNPGSRVHIGDRLQKVYGWKPTKFTDGGQAQIDEDTLLSVPQDTPGIKELVEYLLVVKRLGQLSEGDNAWLKCATKDKPLGGKLTGMHHIHGAVLQSGTITHRAAHIWPNLGQVPKVGTPYGEECRSLFCVPEGWVLVGADASGLELRMLSHYMAKYDDGAYGRTVTEGRNDNGTDIHSVNRDALGLVGKPGRESAKTFIYTFLYGGGELLLGQRIPPTADEISTYKTQKAWKKAQKSLAKRDMPTDDYTTACLIKGGLLKATFLKNLPALDTLINEVKAKAKVLGYLKLLDGRRVPVRHQHAALNSLLQGSGSITVKRWAVRFCRRLTAEFGPQGWTGKWVALLFVHDEFQLAVRPAIVDRVKQILVEEIRATGIEFNLRVALDGEAKHGPHWASTH